METENLIKKAREIYKALKYELDNAPQRMSNVQPILDALMAARKLIAYLKITSSKQTPGEKEASKTYL